MMGRGKGVRAGGPAVRKVDKWPKPLLANMSARFPCPRLSPPTARLQGVLASPPAPLGPECWARPLAAGGGNVTAALLLNRGPTPADVTCNWTSIAPGVLGANSSAAVRDLWAGAGLGDFTGSFTAHALAPHASMLVSVTPAPV